MKIIPAYLRIILLTVFISSFNYPQWVMQNSNTTKNINDICFTDSSSAIAVGDSGLILKTTDYGNTWTPKLSGTANKLNAVASLNPYLVAGGDKAICLSSDNGESWIADTISLDIISSFYSINYSSRNIVLGSNNGLIMYSVNNGDNWVVDSSFYPGLIIVLGIDKFYPELRPQRIYVSASWVYYYSDNIPPANWNSLKVYNNPWYSILTGDLNGNPQFIVSVGGNPGNFTDIYENNYADNIWSRVTTNLPGPLTAIKFINTGNIQYLLCERNRIFTSEDSAKTWTEESVSTNNQLLSFAFSNSQNGFAVGTNGTILFTSNGGVTGINQVKKGNDNFKLYQNYPNPFNPSTIISYSVPKSSFVSIKIYDVLGREITTLVNEDKTPGNYNIEFNAGKLSSSVYYYRMQAGNFAETKKLILMK